MRGEEVSGNFTHHNDGWLKKEPPNKHKQGGKTQKVRPKGGRQLLVPGQFSIQYIWGGGCFGVGFFCSWGGKKIMQNPKDLVEARSSISVRRKYFSPKFGNRCQDIMDEKRK